MRQPLAALVLLGLVALAPSASAQSRVDERRPASPNGLVEIDIAVGSIRVIGWNRDEVQVTGTLGARASGLDFVSRPSRTRIQVEVEGNPNRVSSDLEVRVPAGSRVQVESFSGAIEVRDVSGRVKAESVSGSITITGKASEVDAESVSGAVSITGPATRVRAGSTNASVTIRGSSGVIQAETTNGALEVSGGDFQEARLESVNGVIRFDGGLRTGASLDVETVNGSIELRLPANVGADFTISTYGGAIDSDFEVRLAPSRSKPGQRGRDRHRDEHEKELQFSTGGGGANVAVTTLNGRIALRKR
jgi:DUF4097 and DUF4098 domain-containing protein YvlB